MRFWNAVKAAMAGVEDDGSYETPGGPEDCARLRSEAFAASVESLGLGPDWGGKPYGVIMEAGAERGTLTLVAFATGAGGLYVSTGGGVIGSASHVHVVFQAKALVARAADHAGAFEAATDFPYPPVGQTRFYLLTAGGILAAAEQTRLLAAGESPLSPLFGTSQELLSEFFQLID
jgi:hypothetical protein